jgi:hypothetical protein
VKNSNEKQNDSLLFVLSCCGLDSLLMKFEVGTSDADALAACRCRTVCFWSITWAVVSDFSCSHQANMFLSWDFWEWLIRQWRMQNACRRYLDFRLATMMREAFVAWVLLYVSKAKFVSQSIYGGGAAAVSAVCRGLNNRSWIWLQRCNVHSLELGTLGLGNKLNLLDPCSGVWSGPRCWFFLKGKWFGRVFETWILCARLQYLNLQCTMLLCSLALSSELPGQRL